MFREPQNARRCGRGAQQSDLHLATWTCVRRIARDELFSRFFLGKPCALCLRALWRRLGDFLVSLYAFVNLSVNYVGAQNTSTRVTCPMFTVESLHCGLKPVWELHSSTPAFHPNPIPEGRTKDYMV